MRGRERGRSGRAMGPGGEGRVMRRLRGLGRRLRSREGVRRGVGVARLRKAIILVPTPS